MVLSADDQDKKSLTDKKKSRGQKKVFSIDFTAQVDFGKAFRKTKVSVCPAILFICLSVEFLIVGFDNDVSGSVDKTREGILSAPR